MKYILTHFCYNNKNVLEEICMIKNMKMKTALTIVISFFSILCLSFLYVTTQSGMTRLMKTSAKEKMKTSLNSQAALVDEYVAHQEDLLKKYSISPEVVDYLKDLNNVSKKETNK